MPDFRAMVDCKAASPVKRCLFGEPDHSQVRSELVKQLSMIIQQDREKYNFDFTKGRPLKGRFEWKKVERTVNTTAETRDRLKAEIIPPPVLDCLRLTNTESGTPQKKAVPKRSTKTKSLERSRSTDDRQLTLTGMLLSTA